MPKNDRTEGVAKHTGQQLAQRAFVHQTLDRLLFLNTFKGAEGAYKDAYAHEALKMASMMFDHLAGWARNHLVGRVLVGIDSAPYTPGTDREKGLGVRRPHDDQSLEIKGAAYQFDNVSMNQNIIVELVQECADVLNWKLASEIRRAFEALTFGEPTPLLQPAKTYRKGKAHQLALLRLKAVQHACFRAGTGMRKEEAKLVVAKAYGLGGSIDEGGKTIERWQSRLTRVFDRHTVRDAIDGAIRRGEWAAAQQGRHDITEFDHESLKELEGKYGVLALRRDGGQFRRDHAKRSRKPKRR